MADRNTTFILKRSNVPGKVPTLGQLKLGEMALNTADVKAYAGYTGGFSGATGIREIGWNRVSISGDTLLGKLEYNSDLSPFTGNEIPSADWVINQTDLGYVGVQLPEKGIGKGVGYADEGILDGVKTVVLFDNSSTEKVLLSTIVTDQVDLNENPKLIFTLYNTDIPVVTTSDTIYWEMDCRYVSVGESTNKAIDETFSGTVTFTGGTTNTRQSVGSVVTLDSGLLSAGDEIVIVLRRVPSNPLDNYVADAAISSSWWVYKQKVDPDGITL